MIVIITKHTIFVQTQFKTTGNYISDIITIKYIFKVLVDREAGFYVWIRIGAETSITAMVPCLLARLTETLLIIYIDLFNLVRQKKLLFPAIVWGLYFKVYFKMKIPERS